MFPMATGSLMGSAESGRSLGAPGRALEGLTLGGRNELEGRAKKILLFLFLM